MFEEYWRRVNRARIDGEYLRLMRARPFASRHSAPMLGDYLSWQYSSEAWMVAYGASPEDAVRQAMAAEVAARAPREESRGAPGALHEAPIHAADEWTDQTIYPAEVDRIVGARHPSGIGLTLDERTHNWNGTMVVEVQSPTYLPAQRDFIMLGGAGRTWRDVHLQAVLLPMQVMRDGARIRVRWTQLRGTLRPVSEAERRRPLLLTDVTKSSD